MPDALLTIANIPANAVRDFMVDADEGASNLRFLERPSRIVWAMDATAALGVEVEVFSGSRTVAERGRVPGGGTAGNLPNLRETGRTFLGASGEILNFRIRETGGVATTDVNLYISVEPIA